MNLITISQTLMEQFRSSHRSSSKKRFLHFLITFRNGSLQESMSGFMISGLWRFIACMQWRQDVILFSGDRFDGRVPNCRWSLSVSLSFLLWPVPCG